MSQQATPSATELATNARRPAAAVKIALLLPMTGPPEVRALAKGLRDAAQLALFELDQVNIELMEKDTKGTVDGARTAAATALSDGAQVIVGPLFSQSVKAVSQLSRPAGVPVVAFSNDRSVAGNGTYLMSFLPGADVGRLLTFAAQSGKQRMAALAPRTPYGDAVLAKLMASAPGAGFTVAQTERYDNDANGMTPAVKALGARIAAQKQAKTAGPDRIDTLFVVGNERSVPILAALLPYNDVAPGDVQIMGVGNWEFPGVARDGVLRGAWYPAPEPEGFIAFSRAFNEAYGTAPERMWSLSYDALSMLGALARNNAQGQPFTQATLTRASGFAGVTGLFRLRAEGVVERGLAIMEVQQFGGKTLSPAPKSFAANAGFGGLGGLRPAFTPAPGQTSIATQRLPVAGVEGNALRW
ncbi:MAG: penicillin-binding protein activator [Pseudomonadota bacterium]